MSYKMKGSPLLKDVKRWKWNGEQVMVNDSTLSGSSMDDFGNKTIEYNNTDEDGNKAALCGYSEQDKEALVGW